jgi:hypothetical protein
MSAILLTSLVSFISSSNTASFTGMTEAYAFALNISEETSPPSIKNTVGRTIRTISILFALKPTDTFAIPGRLFVPLVLVFFFVNMKGKENAAITTVRYIQKPAS